MALGFATAALTLPMALSMGLAFGAGPCNVTCLPFITPLFVARQHNPAQAWRVMSWFSAGRLSSYALCGMLAGIAGGLLQQWLQQDWVGWLLGAAAMLLGGNILWQKYRKATVPACASGCSGSGRRTPLSPAGVYLLGLGMALNPCAPLTAILVAASATGSALNGLLLGLSFGAGAVLIPTLLFAVGVAHFGREIRAHLQHWRPHLETLSASLLIGLGILTATGAVRV